MTFLTDDSRRMSRAEVSRKICSKSSVGNVSVSDGGFEADMSCVMVLRVPSADVEVRPRA